jgi:ribosomal protein L37AE/L43A
VSYNKGMPPSRPKKNPNDALAEPPAPMVVAEVDPVLPLPGGTGIPAIKNGQGKEILSDTRLMMIEMPYRAMHMLWEHAEKVAAQQYPKYVGGPLDNAAQAALEAVHGLRSAARGEILPVLTEVEAMRLRAKSAKKSSKKPAKVEADKQLQLELDSAICPECKGSASKKKRKNGQKVWRCASCGFRWPRRSHGEAPVGLLEARSAKSGGTSTGKSQKGTQRPKKRPQKSV